MIVANNKVTIMVPNQIKEDVLRLKKDLKVSMNSIYNTAIQEYVKQKDREKLQKEALSMVSEYENNQEIKEFVEFEEKIIEN